MDTTIFAIAQGATAIVCGIMVEAFKKAGLPTKYAAIVSIVIGMVIGIIMATDRRAGLVGGIIAGGFASGIYSGTKKLKG